VLGVGLPKEKVLAELFGSRTLLVFLQKILAVDKRVFLFN
jgi:hypothetical protein